MTLKVAKMGQILWSVASIILFYSPYTHAFDDTSSQEDLLSVYGDVGLISIATGTEQAIAKAPSVATVITAEDIYATGARDLDEALEMTPGLHVSRSNVAYSPLYIIRGIHSERNQQVLLLINGIPMTSAHFGNRNNTWGGMPVHNIDRIEIIRGPGSAVHGADAFSGVINVVTKTYDTMKDEVGARVGTFDTQEAWLLKKFKIGDIKAAFSFEGLHTNGHKEDILSDAQATLFNPLTSLAPGSVSTRKESIESHLNVEYNNLKLHLGFQGRFNVGTGAGISSALDPDGRTDGYRAVGDIIYHFQPENSSWDTSFQFSFIQLEDNGDTLLFPENGGPFLPNGGNPIFFFPDGVRGEPEVFERHYRASVSTFYTGFNNHRIRFGVGLNVDDMYDIKEKKNFNEQLLPLGSFRDVTNDPNLVFIEPVSRRIYYGFIQDEWAVAQHWDVTFGIRYDNYSDFGNTVNPRAALVWHAHDNLTAKLLYGRAFRAPSFSEQFIQNNPVLQGNDELDPETIDTLELSFNTRPIKNVTMNTTFFAYQMRDILRFVGDNSGKQVAQNTGRQTGYGLEIDAEWKITPYLGLRGNYAFQRSRDDAANEDAGNAPHHQVFLRGDYKFNDELHVNAQMVWIGDRQRVDGDTRSDVDDYTVFDTALHYGSLSSPWRVSFIARNLFNKIGKEPTVSPGLIPGDLPISGRAFFIEAALKL